MALSEWGQWDDRYGAPLEMLDYLTDSYVRRRRFEAKLLAVEIWTVWAESMKPKEKAGDPFLHLAKLGIKVPDGN